MNANFGGASIALLEARMSSELSNLVRRFNGEPYSVPAVREAKLDRPEDVSNFLDALGSGNVSVVVFTTGVGVVALCESASGLGRLEELTDTLRRIEIVSRGPKPTAALSRMGLSPTIKVSEPYTTTETLESLSTLELSGKTVAILHYGERNELLVSELMVRGAQLEELCLYEWRMPEDVDALRRLVTELIDGRFAGIALTSQIQVRHLFQVASEMGRTVELKDALNEKTTVASIGPTCTHSLVNFGVTPHVVPEHPKMGLMISTLAEHIAATRDR